MNIGMSVARAAGVDALLGVLQMFDALRDPEARKAIFGEFEAEHAKLEKAREKAEAYAAGKAAEAAAREKEGDDLLSASRMSAAALTSVAHSEADRIVAEARAIAEQKAAAIEAARSQLAIDRAGVNADKEFAERQLAKSNEAEAAAREVLADAEKKMAEANRVKAAYEAKAQKLAAAIN